MLSIRFVTGSIVIDGPQQNLVAGVQQLGWSDAEWQATRVDGVVFTMELQCYKTGGATYRHYWSRDTPFLC